MMHNRFRKNFDRCEDFIPKKGTNPNKLLTACKRYWNRWRRRQQKKAKNEEF
jgi:hypothetical protein